MVSLPLRVLVPPHQHHSSLCANSVLPVPLTAPAHSFYALAVIIGGVCRWGHAPLILVTPIYIYDGSTASESHARPMHSCHSIRWSRNRNLHIQAWAISGQACRRGVLAVAVEVFMNHEGQSVDLK